MGYHDRNLYETKWSTTSNEEKEKTENPRIQIISPQKKLYDIEQILKRLPEESMTVMELQEAIQRVIDGK